MTIVTDFPQTADISLSFEEEICRLEQEAEDLQNQADLKIRQANMALEQVGLKRQQQARALKALVEAKQALKEAMRLGLELGADAGPVIQRELAAAMDIVIAPPPKPEHPPILIPIDTSDIPSELNPVPAKSQQPPVPVTAMFAPTLPDQVVINETPTNKEVELPTVTELVELPVRDPFDIAFEDAMSSPKPVRSEAELAKLEKEFDDRLYDKTEPEKESCPQLIEISNRMLYVSDSIDGQQEQACYIGGPTEPGLHAWGKWFTLSPNIASSYEVKSSSKLTKFKFELKLVGMSLPQLRVLKAEGMLAMPPREKTAASKALGRKLLDA